MIFAKEPVMGAVKQRLADDIGQVRAIQFYRQNLRDILRTLARDPRWQTWLAVSPDNAKLWPGIPRNVNVVAQGHGDLGERMDRVIHSLPVGPAVIIGADIPTVRPRHINRVFTLLNQEDVVIGPAGDGGYWVIGMRRRPIPRGAFKNVDWSSGTEMFQTLGNLNRWNSVWAQELYDIDNGEDWHQWRRSKRQ